MPTTKRVEPMALQKKRALVSRLRTIEGHVRGILLMVESDAYCPEILMQAVAVQRAIDRFNFELLESHLESCFISAVRGESEADRERALQEILGIFQSSAGLRGSRFGSGVAERDGGLDHRDSPRTTTIDPLTQDGSRR
jgi:DNA-binding FrmR family transcriptional regulator